MFEFKECLGFKFVKAGEFYLAQTPWCGTFNKKLFKISASLRLIDDRYRNAEETVYLIYSNEILKYVGEYSYNLEVRCLKKNYFYHHKYLEIESELKPKNEVTLWLAVAPYIRTNKINQLNISKSLEHRIIREFSPTWNKRNNAKDFSSWRNKHCTKVSKLLNN